MPDELTDLLIGQAEDTRNVKRQLGELPKVTGIQVEKTGIVKVIVKQVVVKIRNIAGDVLIWGNPVYGIWGNFKWGSEANSSFVLGLSKLGVNTLGSQTSDWVVHYDSGDLE